MGTKVYINPFHGTSVFPSPLKTSGTRGSPMFLEQQPLSIAMGVLKNSAKFTGKHLTPMPESFSIKLQASGLQLD